jgi:tetratricopeptide (TPR) repeat protein
MRSGARPAVVACLLLTVDLSLASGSQAPCASPPYDCAVAQVQRGEFAAAIPALEALAAQKPPDLRVLNLLGIALTGAGRLAEASGRFRAALEIDPRFAPALRNLAVNELNLGRATEAERLFRTVLEQAPVDEIAHAGLGEIELGRKNYRQALAHFEKGGSRVAQSPRWTLQQATALLAEKRTPDAAALMDRLAARDPGIWFDAGVVFGRHDAHEAAARFFGRARRLGYKDAYAAGYNETLMLINAGDHDAAIRVANELFASGQRPAELHNLVSRAYAGLDRIKEAYDALREATRLEPKSAEHYIDMAMLCLEHENYDLGLEIVDIGLKHRPDSSMLYLQRGVVLAMKGSLEQAEQEFSRASAAAPDDASPYVALAMVWMQRGQTSRAIETLRTRTRAPATSSAAVIHYALGIAILRSGAAPEDPAGTEALGAFRSAVRLQPAFASAQAELGKLLLKRNDVEGAIAHLEKAIDLEPESSTPAYVLAQAYRRAGQTERARDLLARVSRLNAQERGDDADGDLRRAMFRIVRESARTAPSAAWPSPDSAANGASAAAACAAAGDLDGAIETLRRTVAAAPAVPAIRYQLAVTLWNRYQRASRREKTDLDEAVAELSRAVDMDDHQPHFHLVLGQLFAEQQAFTRAISHLARAAALSPADPEAAYNLGLALRLQGNMEGAETQLRAALAKDQDHGLARRSLGLVLRQKGDLAGAASELRRAVRQLPLDAQGQHLLGSVLLKLGETAGAIAGLREAVRLDPALAEARVLLAQALARLGQQDEAQREQLEVERINARKAALGRALVLLDSSTALLERGDVAGAIAQRREAVHASPDLAEAHYELGLALQRVPQAMADAEAALRQAIGLDPRFARAHAALARLLDAKGDSQAAAAARSRAAELAPCAASLGLSP